MWKVNSVVLVAFVFFTWACSFVSADEALPYTHYKKYFFVEEEADFTTARNIEALDGVRFCNLAPDQQVDLDVNGYPSCDFVGYAESIMVLVIVPLILAGLSLFGCVIYIFCACCSCCGCCMCCCCTKERDLLSNCIMIVVKILIAVSAAIAAVGLAFMITGSTQVSTSIVAIETTAFDVLDEFAVRIANITSIVAQIPSDLFTADISVAIERIQSFPAEFKSETEGVFVTVDKFNQGREAAVFIAGITCVALVALAFLLSFFKLRTLLIMVCVLLLLALFVLWISLSIHVFTSEVIDDICYEVDLLQVQVNEGTLNGSGPLGYLVKCKNDDPNTLGMLDQVNQGRAQAAQIACNSLEDACTYPGVTCTNYDPATCNMAYVVSADTNVAITDVIVNCDTGGGNFQNVNDPSQCTTVVGATYTATNRTISECASSCDNTDLRGYSQTVLDYLAYIKLFEQLFAQFMEVLSCRFVYDAFISVKDIVCELFLLAVQYIAIGCGIMAGGVSLGVILSTYVFTHLPYKK